MNSHSPVARIAHDPARLTDFPPTRIDHRTAGSGLGSLGGDFMTFDTDGRTDPWTLKYEEIIYVIAGEVSLTVIEDGGESVVEGRPGDVIVLREGATVRYGGTAGTHLFLAITPVNWRELQN